MAEGFEIASAYVRVSPDTSDFAEELEAKVEEATSGVEGTVRITVEADAGEASADLDDVKSKRDDLDGSKAEIEVGASTDEAKAGLDEVKGAADELDGSRADVTVGASTGDATAGLDEVKSSSDELDGTTATVTAEASTGEATEQIAELRRQLAVLQAQRAGIVVEADASQADVTIAQLQSKIAALNEDQARPSADLDDAAAKTKIADLQASIAVLRAQKAGIEIDADASPAEVKIAELEAQLDALKEQGSTFELGGEGSMLGAITTGVGAILPGIGGAATGLGLLGATGGLAFSGIAKALSAAHEASQNVGMTSQQVAAQNYSNSVQTQQAQQSVSEASQQSAQDQISSAQSIESAQLNLSSVTQNSAQAQIQALQSVQQADQGVQEATYNLSEANYNLGQAYVSAREAIVQTNNALADAKLNVKSATLAVAQAEQNQLLVDQNAFSTDLDRQQASLAVAQAKQQVKDATASETDAQTAANLSNKQGVAGSQAVIQAKEAQKQAVFGVTDAQQSAADAQRNLSLTEVNNANQVKEAQLQLSSAQEQAAYQQQQDAQNVANAQANLTDTIKEQKLQWASMLSTENSSANQFQKDFDALSSPAKKFVDQVLSMRGAFTKLETAAQNATLPGFTTFLGGISKLMPTIQSGVTQMGGAISQAFQGMGKSMESAGGQKVLQGLITNGMQFVKTVLPAFGGFFTQLGELGSKKGAVTGLADVLGGLGNGLGGLAKGLTPAIQPLDQIGKAAGKILKALGPALAQDIGFVAKALEPFAKLINSKWGGPFISGIAQVGAALLTLKGLAKILPGQIGEYFGALPGALAKDVWGRIRSGASSLFGWLKSSFSSAGSDSETMVAENGTAMDEFATQNEAAGTSATEMAATHGEAVAEVEAQNEAMEASSEAAATAEDASTGGIGLALQGLIIAGTLLAEHWKTIWGGIKDATLTVWHDVIKPAWDGIKDIFEDAWNFIWNGAGKYLLPLLGPAGLIALGAVELSQHWSSIWNGVQQIAQDFYTWIWTDFGQKIQTFFVSTIPGWLDTFGQKIETFFTSTVPGWLSSFWTGTERLFESGVSKLGTVWDRLRSVFEKPVNFLITKVYDDGIRHFWNDIVGAVGLGSLDLPKVAPLAQGGVLPGYSPGHDTVPAMLSPGEAVLTPGATRAIGGAATVNALNAAHAPSGGRPGGSKFADGGLVRHFGFGGLISDAGSILSGAAHDVTSLASGAFEIGKMVIALGTGNTAAFTNTAAKLIGTSAAGDLGKIMTAIPRTLITDLAKKLKGGVGGGGGSLPGGSSTATGSLPANYRTIASFLASNGFTKFAAAGVAGNIDAESGGLPEQLEIGGGGGGGLIQWTPYPPGYITGNAAQDLMTQLHAILSWGGGPGLVNKAMSPSNAAEIYQDYYEKPANLSASLPTRMASANAVYKAMGWGTFDQGGILPPGPTLTVNGTGQPEAVLNPQQTQWLQQAAQRGAEGASAAPIVNITFSGTQFPGVQQLAELNRQLAMTLGGA